MAPMQRKVQAPICSVFRRFLHERGLKFTTERAVILDIVMRQCGPFDVEQLYIALRESGGHISKATVYRTLKHLTDAGIVRAVVLDQNQTHYEYIYGEDSHDHMVCLISGKVIKFDNAEVIELRNEICKRFGFKPVSHSLRIAGVSSGHQKES